MIVWCEETVVLKFVDHSISIADILKPLTVRPGEKIEKNDESIFKHLDFPLAFPYVACQSQINH